METRAYITMSRIVFVYPVIRDDFIYKSVESLYKFTKDFTVILVDQSFKGLDRTWCDKYVHLYLRMKNQGFAKAANEDCLVTLGIKPTRPETGYGYIQFIENKSPLKKVKTFTEKPELSLAKKFLDSGDFVWNAGLFIGGVRAFLEAYKKYLPEMSEIFDDIAEKISTKEERAAIRSAYAQVKNV